MSQEALKAAFEQAENMVSACRASRSGLPSVMGVGGLSIDPLAAGSMMAQEAYEQERHFDGWVYTAILPQAKKIAQQPLRVGRRHSTPTAGRRHKGVDCQPVRFARKDQLPEQWKSDADTLQLFDNHPILDAFHSPNPTMVTWQLMFSTVAALKLTGRAFWWMPKVNGKRQIWPIPASWMTVNHTETNLYDSWVITPRNSLGTPTTVPGDEVIYFFYPDPHDPFGSSSPLRAQASSVYADESMQQSQAYMFKNGIFPALAVIAGDVTAQDDSEASVPLLYEHQREQITHQLRRLYGGPSKYGNFAILDALIKDIRPISNKPAEMDFMDSGEQMSSRILTGFGTDPVIAGKTEGANRATSASASERFAEWTVNPDIELISQTLTARVAPLYGAGSDILIWLEPVRVKDTDATRADYKLGLANQCVTRNEYRVNVLNLHPVEGGDSCFVLNTMVPSDMPIEDYDDSDASQEAGGNAELDEEIEEDEQSPDAEE